MDKKSKAKYRTGRSIEEVIARRRLDGKQLPPLRSNSQSQSNFFSASQASFFKESRKFNDSGLDPFFNQKEEFDRSMDNRVAVVQTAAGEKALTKDEVISMLSDYCKHLESKLNPDNSAVRMFATPALRYTTSTRGSSYPTFTDTMIKKEQAENEDIFPAPPITAGATMAMPVQIAPPTANFHSHGTTLHHTHHGHGNTRKSEAMHELHSDIHDNLGTIDIKVGNLRQIFRDGNPLEDRRIAITKINAQVRGWLVRCRLGAYRIGLKEWKISRTRRVIFLLNVLCANYVEVTAGVELMIMNRNTLTCLSVFQKWLSVSRSTAPLRRKIRQAAENMAIERKNKALRDMFNALKSVCVGKMSRIQANKERRILIDRIRLETSEKLKKQGMCGVVSQIDLDYALNREILQSFLAKKALLAQKTIFSAFQIIVAMARKKLKTALQFRFRQKAGKCFYAWSDHIYLVGVGLDRKRWAGPRKYEIRYNQKLVDHFARLRRERFVFTPWKQFFYRMMNVKRMNQKHVARFVSINFSGWKRASQYLRNLRKITVTNWKLYPKLLCEKPFRAWSKFIVATKNFASEQTRIVNAYIRWKGRQKLSLIIRTWRHQAIYGRIDGMYTRRMLITSLSEQKLLTSNLEKMLSTQTLELESCKLLLETEIGKRNVLEETVTNLESDITKHRMIEHHLEQETIRLESIIDVSTICVNIC